MEPYTHGVDNSDATVATTFIVAGGVPAVRPVLKHEHIQGCRAPYPRFRFLPVRPGGVCVCVCVCVWVGGGGLRVAHATRIPGATSPHVGVAIGLTAGPCVGGLTPPRLAPVVQMSSSHPPPTPPAPPAKGRGTQPHAARMHRGNGQGVGGSMPLAAIVCAAPPISQLGKSRGFAKCC